MEKQWDHKINLRSYDLIADQWKEARDTIKIVKPIQDWIGLLPKQYRVLDIGCGTGYPVASLLDKSGHIVTGIDASAQMLKFAISLSLKSAEFLQIDILEYKTDHLY